MGKNQDPGSGINIPDPQHWEYFFLKTHCSLRSNNGAVDTTIDQLLAMTADNEEGGGGAAAPSSSVLDTPPPEYSANNLPSYQQAVRSDDL
jgi:hypothetical protein